MSCKNGKIDPPIDYRQDFKNGEIVPACTDAVIASAKSGGLTFPAKPFTVNLKQEVSICTAFITLGQPAPLIDE